MNTATHPGEGLTMHGIKKHLHWLLTQKADMTQKLPYPIVWSNEKPFGRPAFGLHHWHCQ